MVKRMPRNGASEKCVEMEKAGQPAQISEFDFEHFCNGNPLDCYYYRKAINEKTRGKEPKQRF
jgi:hypothetical protein